jgi:nicotinate-nucleotide pyrophosphorylase (carboxylating)
MKIDASRLIQLALAEDFGSAGDVTTAALVDSAARVTARFVNRKPGVVAGLEIIGQVFAALGAEVAIKYHVADGDYAPPQTNLCTVSGSAATILEAERTALNFVCHLSGIATATHQLQSLIAHTSAKVCDTRKTTPGWRALEKYAVRMGGGANHRMGLYDMVMIKDNHLAALGGDIAAAVAKARQHAPGIPVALEVENLDQLRAALTARVDRIMLDNMPVDMMREAVGIKMSWGPGSRADALGRGDIVLEATGGVTAATIIPIAETGVDFISVGAITHSAPILDIGLDFD